MFQMLYRHNKKEQDQLPAHTYQRDTNVGKKKSSVHIQLSGWLRTLDMGLISTGVSGMIIGLFFKLCLDGYEHDGSILHRIVSIVYYTITTFMACYLGFILSGVWDWFAKTGINFFNSLKDMLLGSDWSFLGVLKFLGCALVLSIIIYIGIILLSVALKEYVESFCYGFIGLAIVFLFELICYVVLPKDVWDGTLRLIIEYTVFFACILIPDYIRVSSGDYE